MVNKKQPMNFWKMSVSAPKGKSNLKMPQLKPVKFMNQPKSNAPFKPLYPVPSFRLHPMFRKTDKQKNKSFFNEPLPKVAKKDMKWSDAKRKYPKLSPFGDSDKDGVKNMFDCHPFDKKRQGFMHSRKAGADLNKLYDFQKSPKERKRFSSRDVLEREPGRVRAILHNTPIAELETDKNILTVRSGGYQTTTTKARINKALPSNLGVKQEKGKWIVLDTGGKRFRFKEDMKIKIDPSTKYGELVDGEEIEPKRKLVKLPDKEDMILERVSYGKKSTPEDLREYKIKGTDGPVGTLSEFKEKFKGYKISTTAGNINEAMKKLGEKMEMKIEKVSDKTSLKGDEGGFKNLEPGKVKPRQDGKLEWEEGVGDTIVGDEGEETEFQEAVRKGREAQSKYIEEGQEQGEKNYKSSKSAQDIIDEA